MIDHIGVDVSDFNSSKEFYKAALTPFGYKLAVEFNGLAGFGDGSGEPDFWIYQRQGTTSKVHVAFSSTNRAKVREFYQAALEAGGKDNGPPGIREIYHPNYYGAFVLDPDGHNIEAV